uniref:Pre-mRNA splicing Prp18-interacting factor n=1 Tax=Tanacetum cinerariifolium TaxID=118510 RepID=A0A699IWH3_TANCI|nr:hypothetical protein [Tanacetum cinerariifolium]
MSWYSRCSWCGGPFNNGNCQSCTNVSFGDEFVHNPDPISNDETPDFSYPPSQLQTSSFDQSYLYGCGDLNENSSINGLILNSFNDPPNIVTHLPWHHVENTREPCYNQNFSDNHYPQNSLSFSQLCCEDCEGPHESFQCQPMNQNNFYFGFDQPSQYSINHQPPIIQQDLNLKLIRDELMIEQMNELFKAMQSMFEEYFKREHAANLSTHTPEPSRRFNSIRYDDDDDDDDERTIPLRDIISQLPPSIVITTSPLVLPIKDPEDSLIMENKELSTIPEKESDEFIKSSVEDLIPIPSEFEDTSGSDITPLFDVNEDECFDPGGDFDEIDAFLDIDTSMDVKDGYHDSEGDIIYLESLLTNETIPSLLSRIAPDFEDSRSRGFVLRSLELQS